jgi:hypothetical protein
MKKTQFTLDQALRTSLPKMIKDKKALDAIVEILEDCIYLNNFDVNSNIVETITGKGDFDEFGINIHEFHGVFWISAPEFDDDGYFTSIDDAIAFAEDRYEPFITNYLSKDE